MLVLLIGLIASPIAQHEFLKQAFNVLFKARTKDKNLFINPKKVDDQEDFDELKQKQRRSKKRKKRTEQKDFESDRMEGGSTEHMRFNKYELNGDNMNK